MKNRITKYNLRIDEKFFDFINNEVLPGTQINEDFFWNNFSKLIYDFGPINQQLIIKRDIIQHKLDTWHRERLGKDHDLKEYKKSENYYKKSYAINPDNNKLNKNYSILLLALQRYKEAWAIHDGRLKLDEFKVKNDHIYNTRDKLWTGKKINKNNKVLVIKEQGAGDEILHASMYSDLLKSFPKTKIETDPRLISLFKRSFNNSKSFIPYNTFSKSNKSLKNFDVVMYAGSLGRLFRNRIEDFPKKHFLQRKSQNSW